MSSDISNDNQIGLEEAVFGLQVTAGLRVAKAAPKLVFAYDYQGRRVSKQIFSRNGAGTGWKTEPEKTVLFVWNGWHLVEEITKQGEAEASRYFVHGLDLSQSFEGAGGIGGLLSLVDGDSAFYYLYDANGNVGQLVDADDGSVAAHYEYDAFGKTVTAEGAYGVGNPFRFSTKYWDEETGFYYYGYRYYLVELGRWTNRDPIAEEGGVNLYSFVINDPISDIDYLGFISVHEIYENYMAGYYDPGALTQKKFWKKWSDEERNEWFNEFNSKFGKIINIVSKAHCIPKELLSAIIANEQMDYSVYEQFGENYLGLGNSLGPAQITPNTLKKEKVVDPNRSNRDLRRLLKHTVWNINFAGKLMKNYLNSLCDRTAKGSLSSSFLNLDSGCKYKDFCCLISGKKCSEIVTMDVPSCLIAGMAAIWNNGIGITEIKNIPENSNASNHAVWASMLDDIFK